MAKEMNLLPEGNLGRGSSPRNVHIVRYRVTTPLAFHHFLRERKPMSTWKVYINRLHVK